MVFSLRFAANPDTSGVPDTSGNPTVFNPSTGDKYNPEAALILLPEDTRTQLRNRRPALLEVIEYFNNTP